MVTLRPVVNKDDEYRKAAADAQAMADRSISVVDKESWLRIAQGWLHLIRKPGRSAAENVTDEAEKRGTNQDLQPSPKPPKIPPPRAA